MMNPKSSHAVSSSTRSASGFDLPPFPAPLRQLIARLPQYPPSAAAALILNLWLRELLCGEELSEARGKVICIEVQDIGLHLHFRLHREGIAACASQSPDLTITADFDAFCALARRTVDSDTLFFSRRLVMTGDTDLGLLIRNTIDAADMRSMRPHLPTPRSLLNALRNTVLARS